MRIWERLNLFTRFRQARNLKSIYSEIEYRTILERERSRTDRNNREFSIIVFDIEKADNYEETSLNLVNVLVQRVRSTDEIGWLKEGKSIGVVLPDTSAEGAWKFADDISKSIASTKSPTPYRIFTYPSQWFNSKNRNQTQNRETDTIRHLKLSQTQDSTNFMDGLETLLIPPMPAWKRVIDIIGALFGLILLSPFFLLISLLIKIVSPGTAFFRQERIGFLGKPFNCWKFRTMELNADSSIHQHYVSQLINDDNPMIKLDKKDSRIITFGRILRQTGLDELPQLINVLKGDMSLVGPRPDVFYSFQHYLQWQNKRVDTFPGLTGLWQVSGKNRTTFREMILLDINYMKKRSLWLDSKILLHTIPSILTDAFERPSKRNDKQHA